MNKFRITIAATSLSLLTASTAFAGETVDTPQITGTVQNRIDENCISFKAKDVRNCTSNTVKSSYQLALEFKKRLGSSNPEASSILDEKCVNPLRTVSSKYAPYQAEGIPFEKWLPYYQNDGLLTAWSCIENGIEKAGEISGIDFEPKSREALIDLLKSIEQKKLPDRGMRL